MARKCGSCTLCCTLQGVKEGMPGGEPKLPNVRCPHAKLHPPSCGGCGIYEARPAECSEYACLWLVDETVGGSADRPDKIQVLFEVQPASPTQPSFALARTARRGAEKNPRVQAIISHIRAMGVPVGVVHPEDVVGWGGTVEVLEGG